MSTVSALTITREDAIRLCQELGLPGADEYPNAKLQAKLRSFPKPGVLDAENKPKTDRSKAVLADVQAAYEAEADIIVEGEQPSSAPKAPKSNKPKAEKAPAKDKAAGKLSKAPSSPAKASSKPGKGTAPLGPTKAQKGKGAKAESNGHVSTKKLGCLGAAVKVLQETGKPMSCEELIEYMGKKGYWSTPTGKTPAATLNASIYVEMKKSDTPRFQKEGKGLFSLTKHGKK